MAEAYEETPKSVSSARSLDTGLNVAVVVLVVAVIALAGWFGYTVWQNIQRQELTNAPNRVIKALEAQVRRSPNDVILRVRLGEALGSAGKYPEAIEQFNAALKIDPEHIGAYLDLGMVAMLDDQNDKAKLYFRKVLEFTEGAQFSQVDVRRENALYNLGLITLRDEEYEDAAGYFKGALRIRKDASDTYLNLARALRGLEDYDSAISNLEFALAFDPSFAEAHYTLGQVYEQQEDKVNASYHFFQAASLAPEEELPQEALAAFGPSSDWVSRSRSELKAGSVDEALDAALIASNLDSKSIEAVKAHGEVLVARKAFRDALEVYRKGLEIDAKDAAVLAAIDKIESDHPRDALAVYLKALKADPENKDLKKTVARLKKAAK